MPKRTAPHYLEQDGSRKRRYYSPAHQPDSVYQARYQRAQDYSSTSKPWEFFNQRTAKASKKLQGHRQLSQVPRQNTTNIRGRPQPEDQLLPGGESSSESQEESSDRSVASGDEGMQDPEDQVATPSQHSVDSRYQVTAEDFEFGGQMTLNTTELQQYSIQEDPSQAPSTVQFVQGLNQLLQTGGLSADEVASALALFAQLSLSSHPASMGQSSQLLSILPAEQEEASIQTAGAVVQSSQDVWGSELDRFSQLVDQIVDEHMEEA